MLARMKVLVRRELWEHKALYVAPAVMAGLVVLGNVASFIWSLFKGVHFEAAVAAMEIGGQQVNLAGSAALIGVSSGALNLVLAIVVFFYAIDALYAERKDKSILFWRSLPVTDTETVLSKLLTAVIDATMINVAIALVTQVDLKLMYSLALLVGGGNPIDLMWKQEPFGQLSLLAIYSFTTASLWFAPFIGYFLFCSSFAKRSALIWVFLPVTVVVMLEGIVGQSWNVLRIFGERFAGHSLAAYSAPGGLEFNEEDFEQFVMGADISLLDLMAPIQFVTSSGLWVGFAITGVFLAGAVYFRRLRA